MEVNAKILLDYKDYERLLTVEKEYHELLKAKNEQKGAGQECPTCKNTTKPLSQLVMENERMHALETPVPNIIPSITNPMEVKQSDTESRSASVPWYYIGDM